MPSPLVLCVTRSSVETWKLHCRSRIEWSLELNEYSQNFQCPRTIIIGLAVEQRAAVPGVADAIVVPVEDNQPLTAVVVATLATSVFSPVISPATVLLRELCEWCVQLQYCYYKLEGLRDAVGAKAMDRTLLSLPAR
jgi:hypothetical protein